MLDQGIETARAAVNIPVVGIASSTYHIASQLGNRFGLICANEKTMPEHRRRIKAMGFSEYLISIKPLNIPILKSIERKFELEEKFVEIARYQINQEDVDVIISATGSIGASLGIRALERLEKKLGVPVLEGSGIGLRTLELMVTLHLRQSKKSYPSLSQ
jgi:allantoin racemase